MKSSSVKFDLIVHRRDKKTGRVTEVNPYVMRKHQGVAYFERPKGSGNLFFENNEPAGRYVAGQFTQDEHISWVPPLTEDEKVKQAVAAAMNESAKLRAELDEIKREQKYAAPKAPAKMAKAMPAADVKKESQESV